MCGYKGVLWLDTKTDQECDDFFGGSIRLMEVWNGLRRARELFMSLDTHCREVDSRDLDLDVLDAPYQLDSILEPGATAKLAPGKDAK